MLDLTRDGRGSARDILRRLEAQRRCLVLEVDAEEGGEERSIREFTDDEIAVQLRQIREPPSDVAFQFAFVQFCSAVLQNPGRWTRCLQPGDLLMLVEGVSAVPFQKQALCVLDHVVWVMNRLSGEDEMMSGLELLSRSTLCERLAHIVCDFPDIQTLVFAIDLATSCVRTTSEFRSQLVENGVVQAILDLRADQDTVFVKTDFVRRAAAFSYEQDGVVHMFIDFLMKMLHDSDPELVKQSLKGLENSTKTSYEVLQRVQEETSVLNRITECLEKDVCAVAAARFIHTLFQVTEIPASEFVKYGTIDALIKCLYKDNFDLVSAAVASLEQWLKTPERPADVVLSILRTDPDTFSGASYNNKSQLMKLMETVSTLDARYVSTFCTPDFAQSLCDYILTGDTKLCMQSVNILDNLMCTLQSEQPGVCEQLREIFLASGAGDVLHEMVVTHRDYPGMDGIQRFLEKIEKEDT